MINAPLTCREYLNIVENVLNEGYFQIYLMFRTLTRIHSLQTILKSPEDIFLETVKTNEIVMSYLVQFVNKAKAPWTDENFILNEEYKLVFSVHYRAYQVSKNNDFFLYNFSLLSFTSLYVNSQPEIVSVMLNSMLQDLEMIKKCRVELKIVLKLLDKVEDFNRVEKCICQLSLLLSTLGKKKSLNLLNEAQVNKIMSNISFYIYFSCCTASIVKDPRQKEACL